MDRWTSNARCLGALPSGVDQYTSVSTSRDGRRIVATVANPSAGLWSVPLLDRPVDERDAQPYPLPGPTGRALAPRFSRRSLFFLSTRGTRDGLWKVQDGQSTEVWRGADGCVVRAASCVARRESSGRRRQTGWEAAPRDHVGRRHERADPGAGSIEIEGAAGQSAADWSPDGTRIVAGGRDDKGPALFIIPVDGRSPRSASRRQVGQSGLVAGRQTDRLCRPVRSSVR